MSTNSFGLPSNRKLYRCRVELETEGGERKPFDSVLLTYGDATAERAQYTKDGHFATVILDKDAALKYQDESADNRKTKKGTSH